MNLATRLPFEQMLAVLMVLMPRSQAAFMISMEGQCRVDGCRGANEGTGVPKVPKVKFEDVVGCIHNQIRGQLMEEGTYRA
jgi:hypothetical protein